MKIKWDTTFKDVQGEYYLTSPTGDKEARPITIKDCVFNALDFVTTETNNAETKKTRYAVMQKIIEGTEIDLDDLGVIKAAVDAYPFTTFICGQIIATLNGKEPTLTEVKKGA
jgi:hypothetical protein